MDPKFEDSYEKKVESLKKQKETSLLTIKEDPNQTSWKDDVLYMGSKRFDLRSILNGLHIVGTMPRVVRGPDHYKNGGGSSFKISGIRFDYYDEVVDKKYYESYHIDINDILNKNVFEVREIIFQKINKFFLENPQCEFGSDTIDN